ncbi:hypothetical protein YB2330_000593 [Saitoella coloradoensis]
MFTTTNTSTTQTSNGGIKTRTEIISSQSSQVPSLSTSTSTTSSPPATPPITETPVPTKCKNCTCCAKDAFENCQIDIVQDVTNSIANMGLEVDFTTYPTALAKAQKEIEEKEGAVNVKVPVSPALSLKKKAAQQLEKGEQNEHFDYPTDNAAFDHLPFPRALLTPGMKLTNITSLPTSIVSIKGNPEGQTRETSSYVPPDWVTPHFPDTPTFHAPMTDARELTKPGASKRVFHMAMDVEDYPLNQGEEWMVGGAIGIIAPNAPDMVDDVLDALGLVGDIADEVVELSTEGGRWPTLWGDEKPRRMETTRRELLTWTVDIQSFPPTKKLLRVLAEYASDAKEKTILTFLCSKQGQSAFLQLRSSAHLTLAQLLRAFPSTRGCELSHVLSVLPPLNPRWYSLSNDPMHAPGRKTLEMAFTIVESPDYKRGVRYGVGTGFLERITSEWVREGGKKDIRVPMFRGVHANPLAREFSAFNGPMILIGAGVGVAPFRGFVQRMFKTATDIDNPPSKIWVLQGCRDHTVDELYCGEWVGLDGDSRRVVESQTGKREYVQDEVLRHGDRVWRVMSQEGGKIFMCGSGKMASEGVVGALVEVAMVHGHLNETEAKGLWKEWEKEGRLVMEVWG